MNAYEMPDILDERFRFIYFAPNDSWKKTFTTKTKFSADDEHYLSLKVDILKMYVQ